MCAIDDCEPWTFVDWTKPVARVEHRCCECRRTIRAGEVYRRTQGLCDGRFETYKTCRHCEAMSAFMAEMCGGHPMTELLEELEEHWHEGYASIPFGRLIAQMRRKWHGGKDLVPEHTAELAMSLMGRSMSKKAAS